MSKVQEGPIHVHRDDILGGLLALCLANSRIDRHTKDDSYTAGYQEGFADALDSLAQMWGVGGQFGDARRQISASRPNVSPVRSVIVGGE